MPPTRFEDSSDHPFPFEKTRNDYIGPFNSATKDTTEKSFICLFTFLSSRTVLLESTENITTNICMTETRHFSATRGTPKLLISYTYFDGARKQLRSVLIIFNETSLNETLQVHNLEWRLNPPSVPQFCGVGATRLKDKTNFLPKSRF